MHVPEIARTPDFEGADIDSVAVWRDGKGGGLLFVTAKATHQIIVCDAVSCEPERTIGGLGTAAGEFARPNGIAVAGDVLLVVERDNQRVQAFSVPELTPLGTFGESELVLPYGIDAFRAQGAWQVYITDAFPIAAETAHADYGERVEHFSLRISQDSVEAKHIRSFGAVEGEGRLWRVESIVADSHNDRLFISDEARLDVKVYDRAGRYIETIGGGHFRYEPEGMVIVEDESAPTGGWLVAADQGLKLTRMLVFTRDGRALIRIFTGEPVLANTDGIAFSPGNLGPFQGGALYCVHDDLRVQAYSWADVLEALQAPKPSATDLFPAAIAK